MGFDNTNSGAIFKNERREHDRQPTHQGNLIVKCPHCQETQEFWLSAWTKVAGPQARNPGMRFFSLAINPKDEQQQQQQTSPMEQDDFDEEVPF
jgi:hypothetical protein|tara:strand:+ start:7806 stop:8087 length:282 start_codon:yes stop_codon:yes gene_type:complete